MRWDPNQVHLLTAVRELHRIVEELRYEVKAMSSKIDDMQEEWREEYEPGEESEGEEESEEEEIEWEEWPSDDASVASAPASFLHKPIDF